MSKDTSLEIHAKNEIGPRSNSASMFEAVGFIVIGCGQLVYSTMALMTAAAVVTFEILWMFVRGFFSLGPDGSSADLSPTETGIAAIDLSLSVVSVGVMLSVFSILGGILLLRGKRHAFTTIVVTICAFELAFAHWSATLYVGAGIYATIGIVGCLIVLKNWKTRALSTVPASVP